MPPPAPFKLPPSPPLPPSLFPQSFGPTGILPFCLFPVPLAQIVINIAFARSLFLFLDIFFPSLNSRSIFVFSSPSPFPLASPPSLRQRRVRPHTTGLNGCRTVELFLWPPGTPFPHVLPFIQHSFPVQIAGKQFFLPQLVWPLVLSLSRPSSFKRKTFGCPTLLSAWFRYLPSNPPHPSLQPRNSSLLRLFFTPCSNPS